MHRRMRQLSLTETETFVNLAKHALETLNASDEEDPASKDRIQSRYSDEENNAGGNGDDGRVPSAVSPTSLKAIHSEPVFMKKRKKRLGIALGQTEEAEEEIEMENRWLGSTDAADDDILQFVARSTSDIELDIERADDDDAEPSGDETTHLATAKNLLLC